MSATGRIVRRLRSKKSIKARSELLFCLANNSPDIENELMTESGLRATMARAILLIAGVLLLGPWSITLQAAELSDREYRERLVGTWWAKSPHKQDKNVLVYGEIAYAQDGAARAV
ncbi:MAG: hypothetical protein OEM93_05985, partial [Rhodospirillales bacterium]|nr:hypothetical protein [Rhodospirillales bacterium]